MNKMKHTRDAKLQARSRVSIFFDGVDFNCHFSMEWNGMKSYEINLYFEFMLN